MAIDHLLQEDGVSFIQLEGTTDHLILESSTEDEHGGDTAVLIRTFKMRGKR